MKCPHCGTELEKGTIFCPKCLEEIHWVPEYNTLETIITKEKVKKIEKQFEKKPKKKPRRKHSIAYLLLFLVLAGVLVSGGCFAYFQYQNMNSFSYQYDQAQSAYMDGNYSEAMDYCDRAIVLKPESTSANVLYAKILESQDDYESALAILSTYIKDYPDASAAYGEIIHIYEEHSDMNSIKELMSACESDEIRSTYSDYICEDPQISINTGTYTDVLNVQISCTNENDVIHYTLDGTEATVDSPRYEESLVIGKGVTQLNAIAVNPKGITSGNIFKKYVVSISGPGAPAITPESGSYTANGKITVAVPEGCLAYYAFDGVPTSASTQYLTPVDMPEGTHTFYAILVGANGKASEVSSQTYTLTY